MRFRPEQRLWRQRDFRAAREQGRRLECGGFTLWYLPRAPESAPPGLPVNPRALYPGARVGVVAAGAVVGGAVQRNRAKRRLRDVFRRHQALIPAGIDVLLIARRTLAKMTATELEQRFLEACRRVFPEPRP